MVRRFPDSIPPLTRVAISFLCLLALSPTLVMAQEGEIHVVEGETGLVSFGVSAGFPAFQTLALNGSVQYRYFGAALRAAWTPAAGPYVGLAARGYPPVPGVPVPVFGQLGVGVHQGGTVVTAAVGAQVPLAPRVRMDIEAGVAAVPLLDDREIVPFVSLGVSYAFAIDLSAPRSELPTSPASREPAEVSETVTCSGTPDEEQLRSAVAATVRDFVRDAQATYGSLYDDPRYSYEIDEITVQGNDAEVSITYQGSVVEIATGARIEATGSASGTFRWNGCSWRRTSISY